MTKRVYHPELPTWQDVDDSDVASWSDAGWLKSPSKNVDYGDLPPVGEHPGFATVPVLEPARSTVTESRGGSASTSSSSTGTRGTTTARTAGTATT